MHRAMDLARLEARARRASWAITLPQLWVVVVVCMPAIVALALPLSTIDLAYHVRTGNLMLHTHHLVRVDTFTLTAHGHPWLNQQWGAQLMLAALWRAGAWTALGLARAALVGVIFLLVFRACIAAGASVRRAAALTLAAALVAIPGYGLRPQLFGMALFALTAWILAERHAHPRRLWAIPLVTLVWANVHGSFFLGPLLVGLTWLVDRKDRTPAARRTLVVALASLAATAITPFGPRVWSYAWNIGTSSRIRHTITEWQPPTIRTVPGAIFWISVLVVAAVLARRGRATPWPALVSLGVFFALALPAVRGVTWWALAAAPIMASVLREEREPAGVHPDRPSVANTALAATLVVLVAFTSLQWSDASRGGTPPAREATDAPAGVTATLQRVLRPGEAFFNAQRWGSWFELALPGHPVFTDSRIEVIPEEAWNDNTDVSQGAAWWQAILDRWGIRVVAIDRKQQAGLVPLITRDPEWRSVYSGPDGLVFVRS